MKSIQYKLTVMTLAIFIVALSLLGGLNYWKAREMLVNDLMKNMKTVAENSASMAGDWLNTRKAELVMIAASPVLKKGDVAESVAFLSNAVQSNHDYISIGYILSNGEMFHSEGTKENVIDRDYFKQAMAGKTFISDPLVSRSNGHLVTVIAIPVKNGEQVIGVIAGAVDMEGFAAKVLAVKVEQTGFAYVMQKNGLTIVHPDPAIAMKSNPLEGSDLPHSITSTAERMVNGERDVVRYDYKGVEKAVAFAPIPGVNWSLAVTVPVAEVTGMVSVLTIISLTTGMIILIVAGLLIRWYARRIARPIKQLEQAADRIAGGDLSIVQIDITSRDEIGRLGRSFTRMTDQLRTLVQKINLTADQVVTSSEQVTANASQSAEAANQVAVSIVQTAEGTDKQSKTIHDVLQWMEEITTGAQQAVRGAQHELDITKRAVEKAVAGNSAADTAVNQMNTIRTTVDGSAKVVLELSEHSKQIGNIVETISSIAGQTNLLALNAAIEAARAGEQGRGFAVVAEEVRKLAEESEHATKQIATLISDIQMKTEHAVQTMMVGAEAVEQGTNIVGQAGVAFKNIVNEVQQVAELSQQSVNSQNHMAESSDKILKAMENVDTISLDIAKQSADISAATEEQSAAMEEIAASSQSMTKLSVDLKDTVQQFKL